MCHRSGYLWPALLTHHIALVPSFQCLESCPLAHCTQHGMCPGTRVRLRHAPTRHDTCYPSCASVLASLQLHPRLQAGGGTAALLTTVTRQQDGEEESTRASLTRLTHALNRSPGGAHVALPVCKALVAADSSDARCIAPCCPFSPDNTASPLLRQHLCHLLSRSSSPPRVSQRASFERLLVCCQGPTGGSQSRTQIAFSLHEALCVASRAARTASALAEAHRM